MFLRYLKVGVVDHNLYSIAVSKCMVASKKLLVVGMLSTWWIMLRKMHKLYLRIHCGDFSYLEYELTNSTLNLDVE